MGILTPHEMCEKAILVGVKKGRDAECEDGVAWNICRGVYCACWRGGKILCFVSEINSENYGAICVVIFANVYT